MWGGMLTVGGFSGDYFSMLEYPLCLQFGAGNSQSFQKPLRTVCDRTEDLNFCCSMRFLVCFWCLTFSAVW